MSAILASPCTALCTRTASTARAPAHEEPAGVGLLRQRGNGFVSQSDDGCIAATPPSSASATPLSAGARSYPPGIGSAGPIAMPLPEIGTPRAGSRTNASAIGCPPRRRSGHGPGRRPDCLRRPLQCEVCITSSNYKLAGQEFWCPVALPVPLASCDYLTNSHFSTR
jgi:hypothetical protein